jgi:hypothetical protein
LKLPKDEKMIFDACAYQIGKLTFGLANEVQMDYSIIDLLH